MRLAGSVAAVLAAAAMACTTVVERGARPIAPPRPDGDAIPEVASLAPTLRWEPARDPGATYDLVVVPADGCMRASALPAVYYRAGIRGASHRIDEPLRPGTTYLWAVRIRRGEAAGSWSTYDRSRRFLFWASEDRDLAHTFRTPGQSRP